MGWWVRFRIGDNPEVNKEIVVKDADAQSQINPRDLSSERATLIILPSTRRAELRAGVEMEGLLVRLDGKAACLPCLQATFEKFSPYKAQG